METLGERQREDDLHWRKDKKLDQWRAIQSGERGKNETSGYSLKKEKRKKQEK